EHKEESGPIHELEGSRDPSLGDVLAEEHDIGCEPSPAVQTRGDDEVGRLLEKHIAIRCEPGISRSEGRIECLESRMQVDTMRRDAAVEAYDPVDTSVKLDEFAMTGP